MEIEHIGFLEDLIEEKVLLENQLITVSQINQKIHSVFMTEYSKLEIREKLQKYPKLLEVKDESFVCKKSFYKFYFEIKEDENIIRKISRKYFKKLTNKELENLLLTMERDEEYLKLFEVKEEREKEVEESLEVNEPNIEMKFQAGKPELDMKAEEIELETELDIYREVSRKKINYKVDVVQGKLIDMILHGKKTLRIKEFKKIEVLSGFSIEKLIKICLARPDLFYFSTKKSIFFKPLLVAKILEINKSIIPMFKVEEMVIDIFKSRSIKKNDLLDFFREEDKVFNLMATSLEILCDLEMYLELLVKKYELETSVIEDEVEIESIVEKKVEETVEEELEKVERTDWTFETVLEEGLKIGYVKIKWLEAIDFDEEDDIEDYYEAVEELESKDIKVIE